MAKTETKNKTEPKIENTFADFEIDESSYKEENYELDYLAKMDECIIKLRTPGMEFTTIQVLKGKQGKKSGVLFEWVPTGPNIEMDYVLYRVGKSGKFNILIRPMGSPGIKDAFWLSIEPTDQDIARARHKYSNLDGKHHDVNDTFYQQQSQPQYMFDYPIYPNMGGYGNQYGNQNHPANTEIYGFTKHIIEMMREMLKEFKDSFQQNGKVIDADMIKLITISGMFNQGNEAQKSLMAALLKKNDVPDNNNDKLMSIMSDTFGNIINVMAGMQKNGSDLGLLNGAMDVIGKAKDLGGDNKDDLLESFIKSPASAVLLNNVMGNQSSQPVNVNTSPQTTNNDKQPEAPQNEITTVLSQIANGMADLSNKINYLNNEVETLKKKESVPVVNDNSKIIIDDLQDSQNPQNPQEDKEMLDQLELYRIMMDYIEDRLNIEQTVDILEEKAGDDNHIKNKSIYNLLCILDEDGEKGKKAIIDGFVYYIPKENKTDEIIKLYSDKLDKLLEYYLSLPEEPKELESKNISEDNSTGIKSA